MEKHQERLTSVIQCHKHRKKKHIENNNPQLKPSAFALIFYFVSPAYQNQSLPRLPLAPYTMANGKGNSLHCTPQTRTQIFTTKTNAEFQFSYYPFERSLGLFIFASFFFLFWIHAGIRELLLYCIAWTVFFFLS